MLLYDSIVSISIIVIYYYVLLFSLCVAFVSFIPYFYMRFAYAALAEDIIDILVVLFLTGGHWNTKIDLLLFVFFSFPRKFYRIMAFSLTFGVILCVQQSRL